MKRRAAVISLALGFVCSAPALTAAAADDSLVISALHILEQRYIDPVKPVPLLDAAIASLRASTGLGEDALPDVSPSASEAAAVDQFKEDFKQAALAGKQPAGDLAYAALRGMLASLHDSHVYFMDPEQYKEHESRLAGKPGYEGIGIYTRQMKAADGGSPVFIDDVFPGSPAAKAGLQRFDKILQVDGKELKDTTPEDAAKLMRGPAGSTVTLTIQRKDQTLTVPVLRGAIQIQPVAAQWVRPGVAYLKLYQFSKGSGDQLRSALQSLGAQGPIKAVILDLRGNRGGLRNEEGIVAGAFLPPQTLLARVIGRTHTPLETLTQGTPLVPQAPLVVLIDGGTESAAEVVALGLRFAHRATLVGEKSAGRLGGSSVFPLPEGAMSMTVEWVVGPHYEQVERVGIVPDVEVERTEADMENGEDRQLEGALKVVGAAGRVDTLAAA